MAQVEDLMPTLEGIIFIPLALYFFFLRPQLLFPLLIISTIFEASSVVSAGSIGIQPYYCIAPLFVARFLIVKTPARKRLWRHDAFTRLWVAFAIVSVISATILPFIFRGTLVFDPRISVDNNFLSPAHLSPQMANIVQPVFLTLNVLVVLAATHLPKSIDKAHRVFIRGAYIVIAIVILQSLFFWLGLPFPIKLLNNNPGYTLANITASTLRPNGSFTEPSMAGAVLAAYVAAFLWKYFAGKENILRVAIAAVACLLVASTSSLIASLIIFVVLVLANPVLRLPWFIRIGRIKRLSVFFVSAACLTLLLIIPTFRTVLLAQTLEKGGSDSALVRFGADAFAFNLVLQTHGLGVGLGSNRPSSFLASLLSQVGVIGFVLFVCAAWTTLWPLPKKDRWIGLAALGLLLSMAFGLPDLSFPFLWILFALAAQSKATEAINAQGTYASLP
jgi:hypothetical protein